MTAGQLSNEIESGIATITFSHPQSNSMPSALLVELAERITLLGNDEKVRVIILQSAGDGAFCAGASFDELLTINDIDSARTFFSGFSGVLNAIRKVPKFVIARVHGKVVGGGVGIASACDYAIASGSASIKLSELSIGIGALAIAPAVERKIGVSAFSTLTINAKEWRSADWAMEKGLYSEVYENIDEMDAAIATLCRSLASYNPDAMRAMKEVLWHGTDDWELRMSENVKLVSELVLSDYTKEALKKFKKK